MDNDDESPISLEEQDRIMLQCLAEMNPDTRLAFEKLMVWMAEQPKDSEPMTQERMAENGDTQVMGMKSKLVLQEVLPGLSKDAKYRDQAHFMQVVGAAFLASWRQQ